MNLMPPLDPDTGKVRVPEEAATRNPSSRIQIANEALGRTPFDAYTRRSNSLKHHRVTEKAVVGEEKDDRDLNSKQVWNDLTPLQMTLLILSQEFHGKNLLW